MNLNVGASRRKRVTNAILAELTDWTPDDRIRIFRTGIDGSLSIIQLHALSILEAGGPLSMGRLADELDVSVASVTGIVDRLEERGLIERRPQPSDRRVTEVHVTAAGSQVFANLAELRRARLEGILEGLSDEERISLLIGLRGMRRERRRARRERAADRAAVEGAGA